MTTRFVLPRSHSWARNWRGANIQSCTISPMPCTYMTGKPRSHPCICITLAKTNTAQKPSSPFITSPFRGNFPLNFSRVWVCLLGLFQLRAWSIMVVLATSKRASCFRTKSPPSVPVMRMKSPPSMAAWAWMDCCAPCTVVCRALSMASTPMSGILRPIRLWHKPTTRAIWQNEQ